MPDKAVIVNDRREFTTSRINPDDHHWRSLQPDEDSECRSALRVGETSLALGPIGENLLRRHDLLG
jgi:hypothetical protein